MDWVKRDGYRNAIPVHVKSLLAGWIQRDGVRDAVCHLDVPVHTTFETTYRFSQEELETDDLGRVGKIEVVRSWSDCNSAFARADEGRHRGIVAHLQSNRAKLSEQVCASVRFESRRQECCGFADEKEKTRQVVSGSLGERGWFAAEDQSYIGMS